MLLLNSYLTAMCEIYVPSGLETESNGLPVPSAVCPDLSLLTASPELNTLNCRAKS